MATLQTSTTGLNDFAVHYSNAQPPGLHIRDHIQMFPDQVDNEIYA
jgi:hypothetical protein